MNAIVLSMLALNAIIVFVGLVGNSLVIAVVKKTRSMRTTTNFLLVNLAVADMITLLSNPFVHSRTWPSSAWSDFLCKFLTGNGIVAAVMLVSVFTLVVLAVERYHALAKPMATRIRLTEENYQYAIIAIWCIALAISVPIFVDYRYDKTERRCKGVWSLDFSDWMAKYIIFYFTVAIVSTLIIGYCYFQILRGLYITNTICSEVSISEEEKKTKKKLALLVVMVTVMFYLSHIPFQVFMLCMAFRQEEIGNDAIIIFKALAGLSFINSCVNPIVYAFQSANYRSGFKSIFRC